jgi:hypothetical protein
LLQSRAIAEASDGLFLLPGRFAAAKSRDSNKSSNTLKIFAMRRQDAVSLQINSSKLLIST